MCRTDGRRCPSHSDPLKVAEYNAVRRQRYAANKTTSPTTVDYGFADIENVRPVRNFDQVEKFGQDAEAFRDIIWPDFDEEIWEDRLEELEKRKPDLLLTESEALALYTAQEYRNIRNYLNNPEGFGGLHSKETRAQYAHMVDMIDSAISRVPEDANKRVLYRGMRLKKEIVGEQGLTAYLAEHFPVGGVISQQNYMSTSESLSKAATFSGASGLFPNEDSESVMFEIVSKQGAPLGQGLSILEYEEAEVLMPREAKFKVVAIHERANFQTEELIGGKKSRKLFPTTVIQLVDVDDEGDN